MNGSEEDVPSPIDFHDPIQAQAWERDTIARRPWRPKFFDAFAAALNERFDEPIDILELGSGPGDLAEQILSTCAVRKYVALDFSEAMHALARKRLSGHGNVEYVVRDFGADGWGARLGGFDAVATMQAAHETRHKRHLPNLLNGTASLLREDALLLYCDHYAETNSEKNAALYYDKNEQQAVLGRAGFADIRLLLDIGGMALYSGVKL
jgi:SAM-dependent methyltransferase